MSDMNRVQRWRQQQRDAGKDAWTLWVPRELKLYIEDIALKRHCSPSDLVEQALMTCYPLSADVTDTVTDTHVTDTSQIRLMLQQELRAFLGESPRVQGRGSIHGVTDTVTDTNVEAEAVSAAIPEIPHVTDTVSVTVTDTVTDTVVLPMTYPVTVTVTDTVVVPMTAPVTDTVTDMAAAPNAKRKAPARQRHVTDTVTVTGQALEPFDTTRYYLGKLCPHGHDFEGTGHSLLRKHNQRCRECENASRREKRQAKRQAAPAD